MHIMHIIIIMLTIMHMIMIILSSYSHMIGIAIGIIMRVYALLCMIIHYYHYYEHMRSIVMHDCALL